MAKKILVVDDDPVIVEMVRSGLEHHGYQVNTAPSGIDALNEVKSGLPDLIILDIMMPNMDGTEVARTLKENVRTRHIPIIFLTVLWEKDDPSMGSNDFGANIVLGKPFKLDELLEKIKLLLNEPV